MKLRIAFAAVSACLFGCMGDIQVSGGSSVEDVDGSLPPGRADAAVGVPPPDGAVPPADPVDAGAVGSVDAAPPVGGLDCTVAASWPAEWVAWEDEVLVIVNEKRAAGATCGGESFPPVGPLKMDAALRQAARCHSLDMGVLNYFSHDSKDGRSPWDRIDDAGYTASATGENIAAGQGNPASVMQSWMDSEGHCKNIMNGGSNEIGVGYALTESSDYGKYWTQTFGKRN